MEDVVYFATLWNLQLISYGPYLSADPIGPKEMWMQFLRSASFNGILPVQLQSQVD
jgi:hypothetical protein